MIQVLPDQVTPQLRALFDPHIPAGFRCFAVIAGDAAGRILTDDPSRPTWGVVQEGAFGTLYPGGPLAAPTWNRLIAKQNLASAAIARKLGYRTEKEYRLLAWFKHDQLDWTQTNADERGQNYRTSKP